jgi:hypothetical protein
MDSYAYRLVAALDELAEYGQEPYILEEHGVFKVSVPFKEDDHELLELG